MKKTDPKMTEISLFDKKCDIISSGKVRSEICQNPNLQQTVRAVHTVNFKEIGLSHVEKLTFFRRNFWQVQSISAIFCPKFFRDPLLKASPGPISSQKNHLALNTRFQRSSIPVRNFMGLKKFSKIFKFFLKKFRPPKVKKLPHN